MRYRLVILGMISLAAIVAVVVLRMVSPKDVGQSIVAVAHAKPEVYVQQGHNASVLCVAWSQDGKRVLTGDSYGVAKAWEVANGKEIWTSQAHPAGWVSAVEFLPDGKQVVTAGGDSTIRLWEIGNPKEMIRLTTHAPVNDIAMSSDGRKLVAVTTDSLFRVWDMPSGDEVRQWRIGPHGSICVAISPDGRQVATEGINRGTVALWEMDSGRLRHEWILPEGDPLCVEFSADGTRLFCGTGLRSELANALTFMSDTLTGPLKSGDNLWNVIVWDTGTGQNVSQLPAHSRSIFGVHFLSDGRRLLTAGLDSKLKLWDIAQGVLIRDFSMDGSTILSSAVSPDGQRVLIGNNVGNACIWRSDGAAIIAELSSPASTPWTSVFSGDGSQIVVLHDSVVAFWSLTNGTLSTMPKPVEDSALWWCVEACPYWGARYKDTADSSGRFYLQFWSLERGILGRTVRSGTFPRWSCLFSADGQLALTQTEDSIYTLWDVPSGREVRNFTCRLTQDYFTYCGQYIASLSRDGKFALASRFSADVDYLDFATGKQHVLRGDKGTVVDAVFLGDNEHALISRDAYIIELWDLQQERMTRSYPLDENVGLIVPSEDGRLFAAWLYHSNAMEYPGHATEGAWYGTHIGIWETNTGRKLHEFTGHTGYVTSKTFSMDNRYLLSSSLDGTTRLWNVATGKEIVQFVRFMNGEWIAVTPEGYYAASLNGDAFLNVRMGSKVTGIEPYRSTFYKPEIVEAALRLGDSEAAIHEVLGSKIQRATIADLPDMEPPYLSVKYPKNYDTLKTCDTTLALHIEDRHSPIRSVKVYVNGRSITGNARRGIDDRPFGPQIDIPRDQSTLDLKVSVRLDEGENLITITALGRSEAVDSLHVFVLLGNQRPVLMEIDTVWILAVGVNKYQDKKLNSLRYCVNDAQGIIEAFEGQQGKTCRKVMSLCISDAGPTKPTYENIVDNIGYLRQAKEEDLAVLFLAGHGVNDSYGDFYFLPTDAELTAPHEFKKSKAISGAMLQTAVEVPSRRFVFVDACHSGDVGVDLVKLAREFKDNRVLIMTSSEGTKPSEEADSLKHGLFTYAMIKGLDGDADIIGSDGKVSAMELITYVSDRVFTMTSQRQNPVFWAPGGLSNFAVAVTNEGATR